MTERTQPSGADVEIPLEVVYKQAAKQAADLILIYRLTLRSMLAKRGITTNPGSLDSEIFDGLASKLGIENPYQSVYDRIRPQDKTNSDTSK